MPNFFFSIIAIIVGAALYKQIDFQTYTVQHRGLTVLYAITFIASVFLLIKDMRKSKKA